MKKITALGIFLAACLWAADFWQTKPYTEWSDKDVRKMIENSPWSKPFSLANSLPEGAGGRKGGGVPPLDGPMADMNQGGFGGVGSKGSRGGGEDLDTMRMASATLIIRWQTALPVKQALLRVKYGSEAATSQEAKKVLENQGDNYVVGVAGVPERFMQGIVPVQIKNDLIRYSYLTVKGRDDLHPEDVQFTRNSQLVDVYLVFPRKTPITLDDKEIMFTTRFGTVVVKQSFRLKDMVVNGKLEL